MNIPARSEAEQFGGGPLICALIFLKMRGQGFCGARARRAESSLKNLQIAAMWKDWPTCKARQAQSVERKALDLVVVCLSAAVGAFARGQRARKQYYFQIILQIIC